MRHRRLLLAILLGLTGAAPVRASNVPVGETSRLVHPPEPRHWRGAATEALRVRIWYPVDKARGERLLDVGPLFQGPFVSPDAPLSAQSARYPLIVLSHGTGGSGSDLGWIAAALASSRRSTIRA
jgi:predicted dienelactone hydrolase